MRRDVQARRGAPVGVDKVHGTADGRVDGLARKARGESNGRAGDVDLAPVAVEPRDAQAVPDLRPRHLLQQHGSVDRALMVRPSPARARSESQESQGEEGEEYGDRPGHPNHCRMNARRRQDQGSRIRSASLAPCAGGH